MKCNLIQQAPIWAIRLLSTMGLILAVIHPLQAANSVESNETQPAVGHMPVLKLQPDLPLGTKEVGATDFVSDIVKVGQKVELKDLLVNDYLSKSYFDVDGDIEGGTIAEWLIDGVIVEVGSSFTPLSIHGGQMLTVNIIPKSITGVPQQGLPISGNNGISIRSQLIDKFFIPDKSVHLYNEAISLCANGGGRLPTVLELQEVYKEASAAININSTTHFDMCTKYGWPMAGGYCGGSSYRYRTSEEDPVNVGMGRYQNVVMANGNVDITIGTTTTQVACVKN